MTIKMTLLSLHEDTKNILLLLTTRMKMTLMMSIKLLLLPKTMTTMMMDFVGLSPFFQYCSLEEDGDDS